MFTKKSIIIMSAVIGVLLIFIAGLFIWQKYFSFVFIGSQENNGNSVVNESSSSASMEVGKKATQDLVDEIKKNAENAQSPSQVVSVDRIVDGKMVAVQAVSVAKGTSPITMDTGDVIAKSGEVAQNNVGQGTASSPTQSINIDPAKLPSDSVNLSINSNQTITPNSFSVHPGQAVLLSMTDNSPWSETIIFQDPSLAAIGFSLLPKTTRAMTFNAPAKPGEYLFYSDAPAEAAAGMKGKMIVK
jgi:cytoskeletal protein RodZ